MFNSFKYTALLCSIFIDVKFIQTWQHLQKIRSVYKKGKNRSQKAAATTSTYLDAFSHWNYRKPRTVNLCQSRAQPVYSPPLDYQTVNLQCLVLLSVDSSYCLQQLVILAPCHFWVGAVDAGEGLNLCRFSIWTAMLIIMIW